MGGKEGCLARCRRCVSQIDTTTEARMNARLSSMSAGQVLESGGLVRSCNEKSRFHWLHLSGQAAEARPGSEGAQAG